MNPDYAKRSAPKKAYAYSDKPEQGKIAGENATTQWPARKASDPHSEYKSTASHSEGMGVNQAKGGGSQGKKMKWSRMP